MKDGGQSSPSARQGQIIHYSVWPRAADESDTEVKVTEAILAKRPIYVGQMTHIVASGI